ncbi:DNA-binding response regulator [Nocardioides marmoriginsengisoli]|uniref:DNA-binding response regulator n=2 Tax=Nocardioides marmoriginsengisoli TaxID=661483 RepID=A0A3N0CIQ0_9ACTN|nr:DNA-binding response regulator [Nocardioides marmoriginsengisoli]
MVALLESLDRVEVVGQAADAEEAVRVVAETLPDVVIMDLDLGTGSGVEATREIVRVHAKVGILVVTMLGDDDSLFASIRAGARGYLLKGASAAEIERAVRAVANGEVLLGSQVARRAATYLTGSRTKGVRPFPELTDREREVLDLVARGFDNATIARRLVLSNKTVRNYVYGILTKLGVEGRPQLVIRARDEGLGAD